MQDLKSQSIFNMCFIDVIALFTKDIPSIFVNAMYKTILMSFLYFLHISLTILYDISLGSLK